MHIYIYIYMYIYIYIYISIYKRGGPGPISEAFYVPPARLPDAKMFFRAFRRALLLDHGFQSLHKSLPGAIEAPCWLPLGLKNGDFEREGYKKLQISYFSFLIVREPDF